VKAFNLNFLGTMEVDWKAMPDRGADEEDKEMDHKYCRLDADLTPSQVLEEAAESSSKVSLRCIVLLLGPNIATLGTTSADTYTHWLVDPHADKKLHNVALMR
jgi:hypothetical protein